jgi:hypothetical protein
VATPVVWEFEGGQSKTGWEVQAETVPWGAYRMSWVRVVNHATPPTDKYSLVIGVLPDHAGVKSGSFNSVATEQSYGYFKQLVLHDECCTLLLGSFMYRLVFQTFDSPVAIYGTLVY